MALHDDLLLMTPRIVPVQRQVTVHINRQWFEQHHCIPPSTVMISNVSGHQKQTMREITEQVHLQPIADGTTFTTDFPAEGEYIVLIETPKGMATLSLYALEDDLYQRRPFRGDVHMHSSCSDGKEAPAFVAAACRRIGLDFMALTDHWQYQPSLEAMHAFDHLPIDLRIYPGEEVHVPRLPIHEGIREGSTPAHIVNFGGSFSINEWMHNHEAQFDKEVQELVRSYQLKDSSIDWRSYCECVWTFDKIREAGGLGIFCHPYWFTRYRYDVPEFLTNLIFEEQPYDALELIGGYHLFEIISNHLQVSRYHDERSQGKRIPIVGVSDAHGCETGTLFGWYTTLVFSPSDAFQDLKASIMDLYSVAIEALPDRVPVAHGPFRFVRYAQFLLRDILPAHDALCYEEGLLMHDHLEGDMGAVAKLRAGQGRIKAFYSKVWGLS